jgi:hypothetical protein
MVPLDARPGQRRRSRWRVTSSTLRAPPHLVVAVTCVSARCHGLLSRLPMAILPRDERPKLRRHNEDVHLTVLDGLPADHEDAVRVWHAASVARLLPPSLDRVARIWEKFAEPEACLVIGHVDVHGLCPPRHVGTCRPPTAAGTSQACIGKRLEPHNAVDPDVERARSTPVRRPGISRVGPGNDPWQR